MSATIKASRPASLNRRRRVRQKVHAPAYASFSAASKGGMLDLNEILDISEVGVAVQWASPMEVDRQLELCLDLAEAGEPIPVTARVVWSDSAGRVGLGLAPLPASDLRRLREWLFLNAMAGAANAASSATLPLVSPQRHVLRPSYTDTLAAASAVQREADSLGSNLQAVLSLIASRAQSLLHASGAAIALAAGDVGTGDVGTGDVGTGDVGTGDTGTMTCRASAGPSAPPVGAVLQVGSGFSGECVRTGTMLRCDDAENDPLVDRESCRAFGIRSILAAPVCSNEKVIGLLEVFSSQPNAFDENDGTVLRRFAETILASVHRARRPPDPPAPAPKSFTAPPGSILFAYEPKDGTEDKKLSAEETKPGGIRLSRTHLYLILGVAATIALVLGFILAPWIQPWVREKMHEKMQSEFQARERNGEHTVLASSQPPQPNPASPAPPAVETATLDQLQQLAVKGDSTAENALGLLYAQGDEKQAIKPDDRKAADWFTKAAEHGSVSAQYKLGLLYWGGHHGLPKDSNKAYFWSVLARAGGQESSKDLAKVLANGMTRAQAAAIEQQAEIWYQQHESHAKPSPAH